MSETKLKIRLYGDLLLRRQAKHIGQVTESHRQIMSEMARLMYECSGIGLAAPQVGIQEAMIVIDAGSGLYKLVNPKIVKREGRQVLEEGCLSVPGICIKVKRAKTVKVIGQDEFGKPITIEAQDLLACVFQHEIDHLKGKLIVDYASFFEKIKMKKQLEALKRKARNEKFPESEAKSCQLSRPM
jgi:peptide deformylase